MKDYKRLTKTKKINEYCSTVECGEHCEDCYAGNLYERLAEIENKIENGTLVNFKYAKGQEIFYIAYNVYEYDCPHCGETCQREEIKGVASGRVCGRQFTENKDGVEILYTILIKDSFNGIQLYTKRFEEDCFTDKADAEKKLEELRGGK